MTKEMLEEMKNFEIFVEKMEEIVVTVKTNKINIENGWGVEVFDLRDDKIGMVDSLPKTLQDYAYLWEYVKERFNEYLADYDNPNKSNEMFFDVYWNDPQANRAEYDYLTLWIFFDYQYGIYYQSDTEIEEKIKKRDEKIENSVVRY